MSVALVVMNATSEALDGASSAVSCSIVADRVAIVVLSTAIAVEIFPLLLQFLGHYIHFCLPKNSLSHCCILA